MPELVWEGKYDDKGQIVGPPRVSLPFQTVETVNQSAQERQMALSAAPAGGSREWRNRLIWGDKKYVLPSLLNEFAGKVDLIYPRRPPSARPPARRLPSDAGRPPGVRQRAIASWPR